MKELGQLIASALNRDCIGGNRGEKTRDACAARRTGIVGLRPGVCPAGLGRADDGGDIGFFEVKGADGESIATLEMMASFRG